LVSTTNVRNRTNTSVGKEPLSNFVTLWALWPCVIERARVDQKKNWLFFFMFDDLMI
jgi:hypothetical protein